MSIKKLLSYLWPQTTKVPSDHNGVLEVTLYNGRKMLDSKNANYSFGSLQRILETGLSQIDFQNVNSVLLLGLGGGSVVTSLRNKFNYNQLIHAVELDAKIIEIAQKEFSIATSDNLKIENGDALDFVSSCTNQFNLIIVDIFIDDKVPEAFYAISFCEQLSTLMSSKSALIFNLGLGDINEIKKNAVIDYFKTKDGFSVNLLEKVTGTNTLLIAHKIAP